MDDGRNALLDTSTFKAAVEFAACSDCRLKGIKGQLSKQVRDSSLIRIMQFGYEHPGLAQFRNWVTRQGVEQFDPFFENAMDHITRLSAP